MDRNDYHRARRGGAPPKRTVAADDGRRTLTMVERQLICDLYAEGAVTFTELARRFGVHRQTVADIVRGNEAHDPSD
jgi:transposase-like protein